jgi:peptidoglycan/LPS O-acetylase OafA/YrhL
MQHRPRFNPKIESLRGLAALAVCFTHSIAIYKVDNSPAFWMVPLWHQTFWAGCLLALNTLFNPGAAVILFFVLSGYVLTQSLEGEKSLAGKNIASFYIRRCFRILPMMWAAPLFTFAASRLYYMPQPHEQVTQFCDYMFADRFPIRDLLRNFFLLSFRLSPVTWTMRVELLGSLLMPVIVYAMLRWSRLPQLLLLAALCAIPWLTQSDFKYVVCFYAGALLNNKDLIAACAKRAVLILCVGMAFCTLPRFLDSSSTAGSIAALPGVYVFTSTAGAALVLLGVLAGPARFAILESGPFRLVGRLSYSLYLLHPPFLGLVAGIAFAIHLYPSWSGAVANTLIFLLSVAVTLIASYFSHRWIELPSIALGKRATRFASEKRGNEIRNVSA